MLVLPPQSAAKPKFRLLDRDTYWVESDGERYVVRRVDVAGEVGAVRVLDVESNRVFDVSPPSDCPGSSPPAVAQFDAVGGGNLLWSCSGGTQEWVTDLATQTSRRLPGSYPAPTIYTERVEFVGVGSNWFRVHDFGYHYSVHANVNLTTGAIVADPRSSRKAPDLDDPGLVQRLCSPLKRRHSDSLDLFFDYQYEPPYGLTYGGPGGDWVILERCGQRHPRMLSRCGTHYDDNCGSLQLSRDLITWTTSTKWPHVYAYLPRCDRRLSWDLRSVHPGLHDRSYALVAHAGMKIFLLVIPAYSNAPYPIYVADVAREESQGC